MQFDRNQNNYVQNRCVQFLGELNINGRALIKIISAKMATAPIDNLFIVYAWDA